MSATTRRPFGFVPKRAPTSQAKPEPAQGLPQLFLKACENNCGRSFKVPQTSIARFCSRMCAERAGFAGAYP